MKEVMIEKMKEMFVPMFVEAKKEVIASNYDPKKMKMTDTTIPNKIMKVAKTYSKQLMLEGTFISHWDLYEPVYNACVRESNRVNY